MTKHHGAAEKTTLTSPKKSEKTSTTIQDKARSLSVLDRFFLVVLAALLVLPWVYTPPIVRELAQGLESFMRMEGEVGKQVAPSVKPVDALGHDLDQPVISDVGVSKNNDEL